MNDAGHRVLVIDDDDVHREAIHRLLGTTYDIVDAATARTAEAEMQSCAPDCVLLDYRLPDGTGFQLLPQIRDLGLPVVMMTSQGSEQIAVSAMKHGCHDYIVKNNITSAALAHTITNAIEKAGLRRRVKRQQQELEEFVRTAAHDLRAPLRTIAARCELLQGEASPDEQFDHLRFIAGSVGQLSQLIEALLRYTSLERLDSSQVSVELAEVVEQACAALEATCSETHGTIEIVTPLPRVQGDPAALVQLFQNLLENALKFRGADAPHIRISCAEEGEVSRVSVADNGRGLAPADCERVFRPLARVHTDSPVPGSGLGLAICQRIVARHGGRIWVDSEPGQGATFNFTLRRIRA